VRLSCSPCRRIFSDGGSTILRCAQASSGRSGTRHRAPTTPSAPPADPCRRAYLRLSGGATGTVVRASDGEDLVNSPRVIRRGVRVGRRSATGNRVGGVKPSRGFESHPLRFYVVALRRESQWTILWSLRLQCSLRVALKNRASPSTERVSDVDACASTVGRALPARDTRRA
jgi:hypothetical protein